jgi:hypothetical protein
MNDPVAVTLEVVAVGMRQLGIAASTGVFNAHRIVGEHGKSVAAAQASNGVDRWRLAQGHHSQELLGSPRTQAPTASSIVQKP